MGWGPLLKIFFVGIPYQLQHIGTDRLWGFHNSGGLFGSPDK